MTRIDNKFAELKKSGKKGLFIYIMAGAPDMETTFEAVKAAEKSGADIIELGLPFSDPLADGPVIQEAGIKAIKGGATLSSILDLIVRIRSFSDIPLVGMGYINNILKYGKEKFVKDFKEAGLDGAIIPDVPHEESADLRKICENENFNFIEFVTPDTTDERIKEICSSAKGFIYAVSVNGVTGVREIDYSVIGNVARRVKSETSTPLAVGFGIGSPSAAVSAAKNADAVIVGSAVVRRLLDGKLDEAADFIASLRQALDKMNG